MTLVTKYGLGRKSSWGEAAVFCMGAAVFHCLLEGSFVWVLWLIVSIGAVITAEETRLRGVTMVMLTIRFTAVKNLSQTQVLNLSFLHLWKVMLCVWLRALCKSVLRASWLHLLDKYTTQRRVVSVLLHICCGLCELLIDCHCNHVH